MPFFRLPYPLSLLAFILLLHPRDVLSLGIEFTTPNAGATFPAGLLSVRWQDAGGDPDMSQLDTYSLQLLVGGNTPNDAQVLQTIGAANSSVAAGGVEDTIKAGTAQSIQNGFYLMMTSNTTDGNQVINYSDRFTLISMNGTTDAKYLEAANNAAGDSSNVPAAQYNVLPHPSPTLSTTTSLATGSSSPTSNPTSTSTHGDGDSGNSGNAHMSTAELAALIAGTILAVIGIISVAIWTVFLARRVRRRRGQKKADYMVRELRRSKHAYVDGKAELPSTEHALHPLRTVIPKEVGAGPRPLELDGSETPVELPGCATTIHELEGDVAVWEAASGRKSAAYDPTL